MLTCKHCLNQLDNHNVAGAHTRWCSLNPGRKPNKNSLPKNCTICGNEFIGRGKTCSKKCANTVTDDTKQILSKKRKKYLKENPEKHPWKRENKQSSVPCNNVKEYLTNRNIQFVHEFTPLLDRAFSIDIVFLHIKTGIEINGNQHYDEFGKLKPYYQERHDLIEKAGWKLIEVHYSQCFNDESISKFLNFDIPHDDSGMIESYFEQKRIRNSLKVSVNTLPRGQKVKLKTQQKWEYLKDEIFKHSIDFSKYGWVTKVAKILKISPQKINGWMKHYHPDFFEKECFKRK
jgi:hypothetical protein